MASLPVLFEDNHLLVINKPAMLPTMGVAEDRESVLTVAKAYLKEKYNKPGNVYLGVVSRLDAPVTGVLVIARTSKAASRLTEQFRETEVQKIYWAVVAGAINPPAGRLVNFVRKDERNRKMHVCTAGSPEAKEARLTYRTLSPQGHHCLLEVILETGRKHQIRLQLSEAGHPVIGDRKYGGTTDFSRGIALHSRSVSFRHPVLKTELTFTAEPPASWSRFRLPT
ncbi:RluA family pseudouridine synthase [Lignipirellula cremea]|uniref:Ribosomal large subunit pseudouridine synthase D n=1 Tax=Lignipirellula cremea TaxID=2528010 RepID=A0A518E211_9BACT|nr:RluA family pseudouridine synthase [Lignipirellula cremea]QDU98127.1 Ribosomal large subunit pseudouridine synthase D [Lignipirellula cremea]